MPPEVGEAREQSFDPRVPNVARVYDYMLGGKDNFEADRELAAQLLANAPTSAWIARQNRGFLARAVRYCAEQGIRQFLDVGSGLPTMDNVHEVAHRVSPDARVVYVDNDPVAVVHAQALLAKRPGVVAIEADLRHPEQVLELARSAGQLDFSQPVAVLMGAILHFIPGAQEPARILGTFTAAMAPGSYLLLSHATHDAQPEEAGRATAIYRQASSPLITRTREEIASLFAGLPLVDPGLVYTVQWRPDHLPPGPPEAAGLYAGVARKPATAGDSAQGTPAPGGLAG
jgi:O-methyltransferase involved in polyketide biosynthesis